MLVVLLTVFLSYAELLHMFLLAGDQLTPTDQQIFCTDLMTFEMLTTFLNHDDINVIYASLKVCVAVLLGCHKQQ